MEVEVQGSSVEVRRVCVAAHGAQADARRSVRARSRVEARDERLQVCLLGFGEVGQALAADFAARGVAGLVRLGHPVSGCRTARRAAPRAAKGVRAAAMREDAVAGADLVISAVTAAQDVAAARSVAPHLKRNAYFLDLNSVSPGVKAQAAQIVEAAGGRYVEAAIMSPIAPKRVASPMLLGGPHAAEFLPLARELGFTGAEVFSDQIGQRVGGEDVPQRHRQGHGGAARRVAAGGAPLRRRGRGARVAAAICFRPTTGARTARYMISRSLIHGRRRAEEMREVARTVAKRASSRA